MDWKEKLKMGYICGNCLFQHVEGKNGRCPYDSNIRDSIKNYDYRKLRKYNDCPTVLSLKKADQKLEEKEAKKLIKECKNCKTRCSNPIRRLAGKVDIRDCIGFDGGQKERLMDIFSSVDERNLVNQLMECLQVFVTDGDGILRSTKFLYIGVENGKQFVSDSPGSGRRVFPEEHNYKVKEVTTKSKKEIRFEPI